MKLARRGLRTALASTLLALVAATTPAFAGSSLPTITLSGTVTGLPAHADDSASYTVTAYQLEPVCWIDDQSVEQCTADWSYVSSAYVDATTGAYSVEVPMTKRQMRLVVDGTNLIRNVYGHEASTSPASINDGTNILTDYQDIAGLDIAVFVMPTVSGTITFPEEALAPSPLGSDAATVTLWSYAQPDPNQDYAGGWQQVQAQTFFTGELSASTHYVIAAVPGTYRISVNNYWTGTHFYGGTSLSTATDVTIDIGQDATADIVTTLLPQVSGVLSPPDGYVLDTNIVTILVRFPEGATDSAAWEPVDFAYGQVGADGRFNIPAAAGEYALVAMGSTMYGFYGIEPECFATAGFDKTCMPPTFAVGADGAADINFQLRLFPRITGTVTVPDGIKASGVTVTAERWQVDAGDGTPIDPTPINPCGDEPVCDGVPGGGTYGPGPLPAGATPTQPARGWWTYASQAPLADNGDGTGTYEVYINEPGTYRVTFAGDWVRTVSVGGDEAGPNADALIFSTIAFISRQVDVALEALPTISGTVNLALFEGKDVSAFISVYSYSEFGGDDGNWSWLRNAQVDMQTGAFTIAVPEGRYRLGLSWYPNNPDLPQDCEDCGFFYGGYQLQSASDVVLSKSGASLYFDLPLTAPDAPGQAWVSAVGDGSVTVSWTEPTNIGGSPITGYTVTSEDTDSLCQAAATETSCTVTELENLHSYSFAVVAENAIGSSEPKFTETAVPHTSDFQVWAPSTTVLRDSEAQLWVFGAAGAETVTVKVGREIYEATPDENGVAELWVPTDTAGFRAGVVKTTAKAIVIDEDGHKTRLRASTTLYAPKSTTRAYWRAGTEGTVRVKAAAPGTAFRFVIDGEEVCAADANESGKAACTFAAPEEGDYTVETWTGDMMTGSNDFAVMPSKRRLS